MDRKIWDESLMFNQGMTNMSQSIGSIAKMADEYKQKKMMMGMGNEMLETIKNGGMQALTPQALASMAQKYSSDPNAVGLTLALIKNSGAAAKAMEEFNTQVQATRERGSAADYNITQNTNAINEDKRKSDLHPFTIQKAQNEAIGTGLDNQAKQVDLEYLPKEWQLKIKGLESQLRVDQSTISRNNAAASRDVQGKNNEKLTYREFNGNLIALDQHGNSRTIAKGDSYQAALYMAQKDPSWMSLDESEKPGMIANYVNLLASRPTQSTESMPDFSKMTDDELKRFISGN